MKTYEYRALLEAGDESGFVVTFPDVPEAITQGEDEKDALRQATDALSIALLSYPMRGLPLPLSTFTQGKRVGVAADVAAKLAVLEAFVADGITKSELARRLGKDEREIRRILDPMHATKLPTLVEALTALGHQMVIGITKAA